jgi:hypothetical protein
MAILMDAINPESSWKSRLITLLITVATNQQKAMGFPVGWQYFPIWH